MTVPASAAQKRAARRAEAVAAGRPDLSLTDQHREQLEDLVAELVVADLDRDTEGNAA